MRSLVIFAILGCAVLAVCGKRPKLDEQQKKKMVDMAKLCSEESGATEEDMHSLMAKEIPEKHETQCFVKCIYEKYGVFVTRKDGTYGLSAKTMSEFMIMGNVDEDKQKLAHAVFEKCEKIANEDKCALTKDVIVCFKDTAKEMGLTEAEY